MANAPDQATLDHWASIEPLIGSRPAWVTGVDQIRVAAYEAFNNIYWNKPESFKLAIRGQEGTPIYLPSGRRIVRTAHQYMAPGLQIITDPTMGTPAEIEEATLLLTDLLRRERFYSRFSANKRDGLIKGDWIWQLWADPERLPGRRISILEVDPASYFPKFLNDDNETVIEVVLAEPTFVGTDPAVRRVTYKKETEAGGPSPILVSVATYKTDEWGQPGTDMGLGSPLEVEQKEEKLPVEIDSIPVYHIQNEFEGGWGWGSSEMRGLERIMTAVNQGITDEEFTLVLEGLGVYVTDAGAPVDDKTGEVIPWNIGPARVVELPTGKTFSRVNSSGTVTPYLDHIRFLEGEMDSTSGANDVTRGSVDVAVAESGIALALRMQPLLARMAEKELIVTDVMMQMFFDLRNFFVAYEGLGGVTNIRWLPKYGEKLPINKEKVFDEVVSMLGTTPPTVSTKEARRILTTVGWSFSLDEDIQKEILAEQQAFADASAGPLMADLSTPPTPPNLPLAPEGGTGE